jgi:hypothetical protein
MRDLYHMSLDIKLPKWYFLINLIFNKINFYNLQTLAAND